VGDFLYFFSQKRLQKCDDDTQVCSFWAQASHALCEIDIEAEQASLLCHAIRQPQGLSLLTAVCRIMFLSRPELFYNIDQIQILEEVFDN
jgi:hypothetical protein